MFSQSHKRDLTFLQTLIGDDESGQKLERSDSDKENEAKLNILSGAESAAIITQQPIETKMEQSHDENVWDDFLTEEEISGKKNMKDKNYDENEKEITESVRKVMKDEVVTADVHRQADEEDEKKDEVKQVSKKMNKRLFKQVSHNIPHAPTATGGSHPDLGRHDHDGVHHGNHLETMSDISGRNGRRLRRRRNVPPPRCAGPPQTGDILQEKIQELHALMVKPLFERRQHVTLEQLRHSGSSQHGHHVRKPVSADYVARKEQQQQFSEEIRSDNSDDVYPVLRAAQLQRPRYSRPRTAKQSMTQPISRHDQHKTQSSDTTHTGNTDFQTTADNREDKSDLKDKGKDKQGQGDNESTRISINLRVNDSIRNIRINDSVKNARINNNVRRDNTERNSNTVTENVRNISSSKRDSPERSHESDRSTSRSPNRALLQTDTHLKNSNNPALRKWLKKKNKLLRKQKAEERKRKREERAKKQEEITARQELFIDSGQKVQEWMQQKAKEAREKAKIERNLAREEEREKKEKKEQRFGSLRIKSLERPLSAPTPSGKTTFIPIIRPEVQQEKLRTDNEAGIQFPEALSLSPRESKFVYKRPVSGHVRLMKLQKKMREIEKKTEHQKKIQEKKMAEDKKKKMRMSYDQWLLKKREEDCVKRQDLARQKTLAKSDPELAAIIPELARKRFEHILQTKKRIDTGMKDLDEELNKSFGGADFGTEEQRDLAESSYKMEVSGQSKSLKLRASSAKPNLNPRKSKSPPRPKSSNPRAQILLDKDDDNKGESAQPKPFRLPFPPDQGAPKHVAAKQKKLFSPDVFQSKSDESAEVKNVEILKILGQGKTGATSATPEDKAEETIDVDGRISEGISQSVNEDTSFFVTHGNLGSTDGEKSNSYHGNLGSTEKGKVNSFNENGREHNKILQSELEDDIKIIKNEIDATDFVENSTVSTAESEHTNTARESEIEDDLTDDRHSDVASDEPKFNLENEIEEEEPVFENEPDDLVLIESEHYFTEGENDEIETDMKGSGQSDVLSDELKLNLKQEDEEEEELVFENEAGLPLSKEELTKTTKNSELMTDDNYSELSDSKNFGKHVSFQEEPIIYTASEIVEVVNSDEGDNEEGGKQ